MRFGNLCQRQPTSHGVNEAAALQEVDQLSNSGTPVGLGNLIEEKHPQRDRAVQLTRGWEAFSVRRSGRDEAETSGFADERFRLDFHQHAGSEQGANLDQGRRRSDILEDLAVGSGLYPATLLRPVHSCDHGE